MVLFRKLYYKFNSMSLPLKASLAFMVCSFFQRGISILTTPIFTRLLSTEQYGYYTLFNSWLEIISVFTTLKLAGSIFQQALVKFDDKKDEITASTAGLGTTLTVVSLCVYLPIRKFINNLLEINTFVMICILIASWASLMFEIWADRQRNEYKYKPLVLLTVFTTIAKPVLGFFAVISTVEYKAEARIISLVVVEVIAYSWLFVFFVKRGKYYNKKFWKYSLSLNAPLIPHYLVRMILNQSDRIMIKSMVGLGEAGIYGLAHNLAWMLTLVTTAILNTMNPWIFQRIKKKELDSIGKISYIILIIVATSGLFLIAVAPEIVTIFAPTEYYDAIWIIPPLVISVYFLFMYSLFACFEYYYEKSDYLMIASILGGILNICLNYVFIKKMGFIAAGYTTMVCYVFYVVMHYIFMRKIVKIQLGNYRIYNINAILAISIIFIVTATLMVGTYKIYAVRYLIVMVIIVLAVINRTQMVNLINAIKQESRNIDHK